MLAPRCTIAPAVTPISVADIKANSRLDNDEESTLIEGLIAAAVSYVDGYSGVLGRALITQTWEQKFPQFPKCSQVIGLAVKPVQSVDSITYYDLDNVQQALDPSVYTFLEDESGFYVTLQTDQVWPDTFAREDAVTITYISGYGDDGTAVPARYSQGLKLLVAHWFENREATAGPAMPGLAVELPFAVTVLFGLDRPVVTR